MALLASNNWYEVTWLQTSDAAWAALSPPPGIPGAMADAFVNGVAMVIYVIDSATGQFAFVGGDAYGFDDTLISVQVGPLTANTWTTNDAVSTEYAIDAAGTTVYVYESASGTLRSYPAAGATGTAAMKAFLP